MASPTRSLKLPPLLADAVAIRWTRLKYQSLSAYIIGLIRYDMLVQGSHAVSLPIVRLRPEERDKVDAELLDLTQKGVGIRGEFLVGLLKQITAGEFQTPEQVGEELVRIMAKGEKPKQD